jgi:hypothetical protein
MDKELRETLLRQLDMRAGRLSRLAQLNAPDRIIAAEAVLVLSSVSVLVEEGLAKAVWEKVQTLMRDNQDICICGKSFVMADMPLCPECRKLAEED